MTDEYISREKTLELLKSLSSRDYRRKKGTIQDAIKMISYAVYTPAAESMGSATVSEQRPTQERSCTASARFCMEGFLRSLE